MTEEAKEARRKYKRKWNKEHPDKVKEYQARYWQKKAEQAAAKDSKPDNTAKQG